MHARPNVQLKRTIAVLLIAIMSAGTILGAVPAAFGSAEVMTATGPPPALGSAEVMTATGPPTGFDFAGVTPATGPPTGFEEVASLPVGDGPGEIGILEGPELEPWGPSAFAIDDQGRFHVIDGVNGRVLTLDRNGEIIADLSWHDPVVCPVDIAVVDGRLFVLDLPAQPSAVHELDSEGYPAKTWEIPAYYTDHGITGFDVSTDSRGEADIRLEIAGTWHVPLVSSGIAVGPRMLPTTATDDIVRVPAAAASEVAIERRARGAAFFADKEWTTGRSASVTALRRGRPTAAMTVRSHATLGAIRFLDTDERGNVYVFAEDMVEHSPGNPDIRAFVKRYLPDGTPQAVFELPVERFRTHPERPIRIAAEGTAYVLVPGTESVSILRAEWQDDAEETLPEHETRGFELPERHNPAKSLDDGAGTHEPEGIRSREPDEVGLREPDSIAATIAAALRSLLTPEAASAAWTRTNANDRAWSYVNHRWYCNRRNYSTRNGSIRPRYITSVNRYYRAVPYCWGGFDTLNSYNNAMSAGHSAGDINCTGGKRSGTAGVDCSGFLSRLWGLGTKRSTYTLTNVSYPISKSNMRLGDAYIRPGSHCMFFRYYVTGGAQVFESTKTSSYDRVVTMTRTNTALSNYGAYRYRNW